MTKQSFKVAKFGGSSMADANQFKKIKKIVESDTSRKAIVVSAPGNRFSNDHKITDLLYLCHAHSKYGVSCYSTFGKISKRYKTIIDSLGLKIDLSQEFKDLQKQIDAGMSEDEVVSRGEYYAAKLMAKYLGFVFIDSKDWLFFYMDGSIDIAKSYKTLKKLCKNKKVVIPGFYGSMPDGEIKTLTRGGSDITGALVASALGANVYENWTDVSGVLTADPNVVDNVQSIRYLNYAELRELAYSGAKVLHEETIYPVIETGIPVNIKNVNDPDNPGTIIKEKITKNENKDCEIITGIAGHTGFSILSFTNENNASHLDNQIKILKILKRYGVDNVISTSEVDNDNYILTRDVANKFKYHILNDINKTVSPSSSKLIQDVSIINVVGRNMVGNAQAKSKIFNSLSDENINVIFSSIGVDELSILIGVKDSQYTEAINAINKVVCNK